MSKFFVDLVQVSTQIISAIIACFMGYFAWKTFLKIPAQVSEPEESEDVEADIGSLRSVVVFNTKKQTTTLKVSEDGLECYLKNKEEGEERLQWTISKSDASKYLERKQFNVYPGYRANSGTFSIGPKRNWLYSKKLFPEAIYLEDEIKSLLKASSV